MAKKKQTDKPIKNILFYFEYTGLYSLPLAIFLEKNLISFSMIPASEIKRSLGITKGKNEFVDC